MAKKKSSLEDDRDNVLSETNEIIDSLKQGVLIGRTTYNEQSDRIEPCMMFNAINNDVDRCRHDLSMHGYTLTFNSQGGFYSASKKKGDSVMNYLTLNALSSSFARLPTANTIDIFDHDSGFTMEDLEQLSANTTNRIEFEKLGYSGESPMRTAVESLKAVGLCYQKKNGNTI